jgi:hypothetical protein
MACDAPGALGTILQHRHRQLFDYSATSTGGEVHKEIAMRPNTRGVAIRKQYTVSYPKVHRTLRVQRTEPSQTASYTRHSGIR